MIYTDSLGHLVSDTSLEELHQFARSIGLKRKWFQDGRHPHYDLTTTRARNRALDAGAKLVSPLEIVKILKIR